MYFCMVIMQVLYIYRYMYVHVQYHDIHVFPTEVPSIGETVPQRTKADPLPKEPSSQQQQTSQKPPQPAVKKTSVESSLELVSKTTDKQTEEVQYNLYNIVRNYYNTHVLPYYIAHLYLYIVYTCIIGHLIIMWSMIIIFIIILSISFLAVFHVGQDAHLEVKI